MAMIHKSYTFDPAKFQSVIRKNAFNKNTFESRLLLKLANNVVNRASITTQKYLDSLRFDMEWLDTESESARTHLWYLIALSEVLSPTPSLSNRYLGSFSILRLILPLGGWQSHEIEKLLKGLPLHTLPEFLDDDFLGTERFALDQFGGWLSRDDISLLQERLGSVQDYFSISSSLSIEELAKASISLSTNYLMNQTELLEKSYADAMEMLQSATNLNEALFIILD